MKCKKCGTTIQGTKKEVEAAKTRSLRDEKERVVVDANDPEILPKTRVGCPKCGHNEAYWMMQQTRGADEPQTRFYICVRCKHRWREYQ